MLKTLLELIAQEPKNCTTALKLPTHKLLLHRHHESHLLLLADVAASVQRKGGGRSKTGTTSSGTKTKALRPARSLHVLERDSNPIVVAQKMGGKNGPGLGEIGSPLQRESKKRHSWLQPSGRGEIRVRTRTKNNEALGTAKTPRTPREKQ